MFERCKYANECDAQCSGAIENSETCDSFQLHQSLEQAINQYNQVVNQNKDLQAELNTVKQQYNCYSCGGCKGKEDYRNLEKHHLGLRKQFDIIIQENGKLKEKLNQYKKYKFLFEQAREMKIKTDKWAQKCLSENEDLKDTIKKTVCQAKCYKHKQADKYKSALEEINILIDKLDNLECDYGDFDCDNCSSLEEKTVCTYKIHKLIKNKIDEVLNG